MHAEHCSETHWPAPIRMIARGAVVFVLAIFITAIIPGGVAWIGGVFYKSGLIEHLPADIRLRYQNYEAEKNRLTTLSKSIDARLLNSTIEGSNVIHDLINAKEKIDARLSYMEQKAPIVLVPFYPQPFLFTGPYTALGLLLLVFSSGAPTTTHGRGIVAYAGLGGLIYVIYQIPLWIRNFVTTNEGRVIFAFPNADIYFGSFVTQEIVIFLFSCLLAACWYLWADVGHQARKAAAELEQKDSIFEIEIAEMVSDTFYLWVWHSLILALGFFFLTWFYWDAVHRYNDDRYLASAIIAHTLWGVSWILLSMRLFWIWRSWNRVRLRAIAELANAVESGASARCDSTLKLLAEAQPISHIQASIGWLGAAVSFVAPFVQAFFK